MIIIACFCKQNYINCITSFNKELFLWYEMTKVCKTVFKNHEDVFFTI